MVDQIFASRRLAQIYDPLDPDRSDLDAYVAMAEEFGARSVLDIGLRYRDVRVPARQPRPGRDRGGPSGRFT